MALDGVLLDIDGTFVASNDAHAQAWVEALLLMVMTSHLSKYVHSSVWVAIKSFLNWQQD